MFRTHTAYMVFQLFTFFIDIHTDAMRVEGAEVQASLYSKLLWMWLWMHQIQNVHFSGFIGERRQRRILHPLSVVDDTALRSLH